MVGRLQAERPPLRDIVIISRPPIMSFQKKHESAILPFRVRFAFGLHQMFAGIGSTRKLVTSHHVRDHDMTMRIVQHRPQDLIFASVFLPGLPVCVVVRPCRPRGPHQLEFPSCDA